MSREVIRQVNRQIPKSFSDLLMQVDELNRKMRETIRFVDNLVNAIPADSTASDIPGVVSDFNALLDKLRTLNTR